MFEGPKHRTCNGFMPLYVVVIQSVKAVLCTSMTCLELLKARMPARQLFSSSFPVCTYP